MLIRVKERGFGIRKIERTKRERERVERERGETRRRTKLWEIACLIKILRWR